MEKIKKMPGSAPVLLIV